MKFSFFLKDTKKQDSLIYLVTRIGNDRIKISTGINVSTKSWNAETARVKKNHAGQELNNRLDKIEFTAKEIFNHARMLGITDPKDLFGFVKNKIVDSRLLDRRNMDTSSILSAFNEFLKQLEQGTRPVKRKSLSVVSYSYIQLFITLQNALKEILPDKAPFPYLQSNEFATRFTAYRSSHWNDSSAGKYIVSLRRFMLWARDVHLYSFIEFPSCLTIPEPHETTLFALTDDELRSIENLDLSDRPALDKVRDLFLLSCYTGLRYSDISRLSKEHIGATEIRISAQKTGDNTRCPITPRLRKVLERYAPEYLFHKISSQRANEHLKIIVERAGVCSTLEIVTYKNGRKTSEARPKHELIAWHCSRRTFITLSLVKGAQPAAVQAVSGHKKDSKSFNKYILFADSQVDEQLNAVWE